MKSLQTYRLHKEERLNSRILIEKLFTGGSKSLPAFPLRVVYMIVEGEHLPPVSLLISVPKKRFKRAVKRNLLKRRIRESYRLQKDVLPDGKGADILFIYNSKEVTDSRTVSAAVRQILTDIGNEIRKK